MVIDICMTATLRPEIVRRTLESLSSHVYWQDDWFLILNIDPIGEDKYTVNQIEEIARASFKGPVICKKALVPSRNRAIRWVLGSISSEASYVFYLEDDWEFIEFIALQHMVEELDRGFDMLYFDRADKSILSHNGYKNSFEQINPFVYERIQGKSLCGPPALMTYGYAKKVLGFVKDTVLPLDRISKENENAKEYLSMCRHGVYLGKKAEGYLVRDIGRIWKAEQKISCKMNEDQGLLWTNAQ